MTRRVLLTGAAGVIGSDLARLVPQQGEGWRLTDLRPIPGADGADVMQGDLTDPAFARRVCNGVDAIVHMAGRPKEGDWHDLIRPNVIASATLWEAAREAGVRRIIFGSSNHVDGMYPAGRTLQGIEPARPDSRYAVTKIFCEGLGSYYADKFGIAAFSIRIGSYQAAPRSLRELSTWISPRDLAALVRVGLDATYHCETVFGVSGNARGWVDNARAFALGYAPRDNAEDHAGTISETPGDGPAHLLQGGGSAAKEFSGDLARLVARGE